MDSNRPIRALVRGLDVLTFLNSRDGATASEIAHAVSLPRTTIYRILETFCTAGYVMRSAAAERFHLAMAVRGLSNGFTDEAWVTTSVLPVIEQLGHDLVWPICFATRMDTTMVVRASTEHSTPLGTDKVSVGSRVPILHSAAGRVYLAHCGRQQRDALLAGCSPAQLGTLLPALAEIAAGGYAVQSPPRHRIEATTLAVPVPLAGRDAAALSVRFLTSAVALSEAPQRFIPKMRRSAARISHHYEQQRNAGNPAGPTAAVS